MTETARLAGNARVLDATPFRIPRSGRDEAQSLLRDGLVRTVIADALVAADAPDDQWVRAQATRLLFPEAARSQWVVGFRTAAWVYTGGNPTDRPGPPSGAEVIVLPGRQRPAGPLLYGRQVALAEGEVTELHGLRITTPLRTAADVARDLPIERALPMLQALADECGVPPPQVLRQLSRMRYARGCVRARPIVRAWADL